MKNNLFLILLLSLPLASSAQNSRDAMDAEYLSIDHSYTLNTDGSCEFLSANGCTVHADRPFVCRLYPLLRRVDRTGMETFATVKLHPQCEGEWGEDGTIGKYLAGQQAEDYIYAVDAYLELTAKIVANSLRSGLPSMGSIG